MRSDYRVYPQFGRVAEPDWRRELRVRLFGMVFGIGLAAVGAAALSLSQDHRDSLSRSPMAIRQAVAPSSATTQPTGSKAVERATTSSERVGTENQGDARRASARVTSANERPAIAGVLIGRPDAPTAGQAWGREQPISSTSPKQDPERTIAPTSQQSTVGPDRLSTKHVSGSKPKIGRSSDKESRAVMPDQAYAREGSVNWNGFWAWVLGERPSTVGAAPPRSANK
jgi:hypothetical protein